MHPLNVFLLLFLLLCSHRFTYARWFDIQFRVEPVIEIVRHVGEFEICPSLSYYDTHNWFTSLKLNQCKYLLLPSLKRYKHFNVTCQNKWSGKKYRRNDTHTYTVENWETIPTHELCVFVFSYCNVPPGRGQCWALIIFLSTVSLSNVSQSLFYHPLKQPC